MHNSDISYYKNKVWLQVECYPYIQFANNSYTTFNKINISSCIDDAYVRFRFHVTAGEFESHSVAMFGVCPELLRHAVTTKEKMIRCLLLLIAVWAQRWWYFA